MQNGVQVLFALLFPSFLMFFNKVVYRYSNKCCAGCGSTVFTMPLLATGSMAVCNITIHR